MTAYILPLVIATVVFFGFIKKVEVFNSFTIGAKGGLKTAISIFPTIVGLIVAIEMLKVSGALDIFCNILSPISNFLSLPKEVLPIFLIKPFSGSGATALLNNVLENYGADSIIGRTSAIMCSSGETTFYAVSIYYSAINVKNIKYTLFAGLVANFASGILSGIFARIL